jgi:biofilm protein TabA
MVLDKMSNFKNYISLNPRFPSVLEYLEKTDFNNIAPGDYNIDGRDIYLRVLDPKPSSEKTYKLEAHRQYIDIQYSFKNEFDIGWKTLSDCKNVESEYNEVKDFLLFSDEYDSKYTLSEGLFTILFPEDVHGPMPPDSKMVRIVIKVLI